MASAFQSNDKYEFNGAVEFPFGCWMAVVRILCLCLWYGRLERQRNTPSKEMALLKQPQQGGTHNDTSEATPLNQSIHVGKVVVVSNDFPFERQMMIIVTLL